jgi:antitoxin ParD1/3/4
MCGDGASGAFALELIRHDRDRQALRELLLHGGASQPTRVADEAYFADLRQRVRAS